MSILKITARTHVGLERDHNEDNFIISSDLSRQMWTFDTQQNFQLGKYGSLLVVADGMGGMNAGEVASKIAVESMQEYFNMNLKNSPELTPDFVKNVLKKAILHANTSIVNRQKIDKSTEGMGTTLILAWVIENKLFCSWSGDSRCYLFNPSLSIDEERKAFFQKNRRIVTGNLTEISKDHSYVQELIDKKKITPEQAFYHPDSNIVTQSLGDEIHPPQPDFFSIDLKPQDRILLCSDGLNGMLQDKQINEIIQQCPNINDCTQELIDNANKAGGHDNITVAMADVINIANDTLSPSPKEGKNPYKSATYALATLSLLLLIYIVASALFFKKGEEYQRITFKENSTVKLGDTIIILRKDSSYNIVLNSIDTVLNNAPETSEANTSGRDSSESSPKTKKPLNEMTADDNKEERDSVKHLQNTPSDEGSSEVVTKSNMDKLRDVLEAIKEQSKDQKYKDFNTQLKAILDQKQDYTKLSNEVCTLIAMEEKPSLDSLFIKLETLIDCSNTLTNLDNKEVSGDSSVSTTDSQATAIPKAKIVEEIDLGNDLFKFKREEDGKWGLLKQEGQEITIILEPTYNDITNFNDGMAGVNSGKSWGYINEEGELIIETKYDQVWAFEEGKAKVKKGKECFSINKNNQLVGEKKPCN